MKKGNPQLENGYVKIANELWDALTAIRIPGEMRQVLDVIIRKTYGFNKKMDWIPLLQFVKATGLSKVHVCRALKRLTGEMNIVTQKGNSKSVSYSLNKHYLTWKPLPKKVTVTQKGNKPLPNRDTSKDILFLIKKKKLKIKKKKRKGILFPFKKTKRG